MKWLITAISAIFSLSASAQHFSWLSTGHNLELEVKHAAMSREKNMMVISEGRTPYFIDGEIELVTNVLVDTSVRQLAAERVYPNERYIFASYDAAGNYLWAKDLSTRFIEVLGLDCNSAGEFVLCCFLEGLYDSDEIENFVEDNFKTDPEKMYTDLSMFEGGESLKQRYVESGFYALRLTKTGELIEATLIASEDVEGLDIEGFMCTPQNNYLIYGHFDDDLNLPQFKSEVKKAGGDFFFVYDAEGKWLWGDLGIYQHNSCCSYTVDALHVAVAPDGSVYVTGTAQRDVLFARSKQLVSVPKDDSDSKAVKYETYLAAYNPEGKMKWLKQSNSPLLMQSICASQDQVFVAYNWSRPVAAPFGIQADTTNNRKGVIVAFSEKGKLNWCATEPAQYTQKMVFADNKLYVANGMAFRQNPVSLGTHTFSKLERSYISVYTSKGGFKNLKPVLPDFDYKAQPTFFFPVSENEYYVAYSSFFGMSIPLKVYDKLFGNLNGYGHAAVIGKLHE